MNPNAEKYNFSYYNHIAKEYERLYSRYIESVEAEYTHVVELLANSYPQGPVLEVGCGSGALTKILARFNKYVTAIDICDDVLDIINARLASFDLRKKVRIMKADVVNLPKELKKGSYPLVVFWGNGLGHIPCDDYAALAENISRAMHSNGVFILNFRDGKEWVKNTGMLEQVGNDDNGAYYFFIYSPAHSKICDKFEFAVFYIPNENAVNGVRVLSEKSQAYFSDFDALCEELDKWQISLKTVYGAKGLDALKTAIFTRS